MDYSIMTENQFGILSDTHMGQENGGGEFRVVRNKRRCVHLSPIDKQSFDEQSMDEKLYTIFGEIRSVKDIQLNMQKGMNLLVENQEQMGQNVKRVYGFANNNTDMIRLLAYKSIDLEARSRRNNLIFRNIAYRRGDSCFGVIREFLDLQMGIDGNDM
ncbi:MAG: hypothetical protein ABW185_26130, partial [Sedimenticola sp.]